MAGATAITQDMPTAAQLDAWLAHIGACSDARRVMRRLYHPSAALDLIQKIDVEWLEWLSTCLWTTFDEQYSEEIDHAYAAYEAIRQPAYAAYQAIAEPAYAAYQAIAEPAYAAYQAIREPAYAAYEATEPRDGVAYKVAKATAYAAYQAIREPAYAAYEAIAEPAYAAYEAIAEPAYAAYARAATGALVRKQRALRSQRALDEFATQWRAWRDDHECE